MEVILALAIGILGGSGVWLVLRPRTFQVLMGLSLLSYAVNLFIFAMGSLQLDREPIVQPGLAPSLDNYTDPLPQALVLTAIVITFGVTALLLALAYRSWLLTDDDEVEDDVSDRVIAGGGFIDREVTDADAALADVIDPAGGHRATNRRRRR